MKARLSRAWSSVRDATTTPSSRAAAAMASGSSNRAIRRQVRPTELVQQTGRRRERRPEPIADRDEFDLARLVQRDQVFEVNLAHAANAKRAKSQPFVIHVKESIGRNQGPSARRADQLAVANQSRGLVGADLDRAIGQERDREGVVIDVRDEVPQSSPDSMRSRFSTVIARLRSSASAGLSFGKNDSTGWSRRRIFLATATPVSVEVMVFVTDATSCGTVDRYG